MSERQNRFRAVDPAIVPWYERRNHDVLTCLLVERGATDAEAADIFALEADRLRHAMGKLPEQQLVPLVVISDPA